MHLVAFAQVAGGVDYLCGPPAGLVLLALPVSGGRGLMAGIENVPAVLLLGLPALIYAFVLRVLLVLHPPATSGLPCVRHGRRRVRNRAAARRGRPLPPAAGRFLPAGAGLLACAARAVWLGFRPPLGEGFRWTMRGT
jgi:hypothetical protein